MTMTPTDAQARAKEIAIELRDEVRFYLESMYAEEWKGLSKSCRTPLLNTMFNKANCTIAAALLHAVQEQREVDAKVADDSEREALRVECGRLDGACCVNTSRSIAHAIRSQP